MDNQNTKRNVIKEQWDVATMMPREFNKRSLTAKGLVAIWFAMARWPFVSRYLHNLQNYIRLYPWDRLLLCFSLRIHFYV